MPNRRATTFSLRTTSKVGKDGAVGGGGVCLETDGAVRAGRGTKKTKEGNRKRLFFLQKSRQRFFKSLRFHAGAR